MGSIIAQTTLEVGSSALRPPNGRSRSVDYRSKRSPGGLFAGTARRTHSAVCAARFTISRNSVNLPGSGGDATYSQWRYRRAFFKRKLVSTYEGIIAVLLRFNTLIRDQQPDPTGIGWIEKVAIVRGQ